MSRKALNRQTFTLSHLIFGCLLLTGTLVFSIQFRHTLADSPVYCDSGYYLAIARQMADGLSLYSDIQCAYPPLWLYVMKGIFLLVPDAGYEWWLWFQALVNLTAGLFIGLIVFKFTQSRNFAVVAGWLFACTSFGLGGDALLLEVPSLLAGLVSAWILLTRPQSPTAALAAGLLAAASMAVKQYGGGFILLNIILLWNSCDRFWSRLGGYAAGVMLLWGGLLLVNPDVLSIFKTNYGTSPTADALYTGAPLLRNIPEAFFRMWHDFMPALVLLLWIPLYRQRRQCQALLWCLGGLLGFLGQFYFNNGDHYYLYLTGIGSIAVGCLGAYSAGSSKILHAAYSILLLYTFNCQRLRYADWHWYHEGEKRFEQRISDNIRQTTPADASLYVFNAEHFGQYYLTGRRPAAVNGKLSYSFGPLVLTDELVSYRIRHSDYILKRTDLDWEFKVCDSLQALLGQCDTLWRDSTVVLMAPALSTREQD